MKYKRILVCGGAGFIGSHFANLLHEKDYDVVVVDKLTYAANINNLNPEIVFIEKDINDLFFSYKADVIVNFAAETHVDNSIVSDTEFYSSNIMGVANLLKVARKDNVKRFIQISTDEVYGSSDIPCKEDALLKPSNPYSASKAAAEHLCLAYYRTYGLNVGITRGANTYGDNQYPEKLIPKCIKAALNDAALPIYGDGSARRTYLHVLDHCRAIETVMNNGDAGEIYNIPGTVEMSALDIARWICYLTDRKEDLIEFVPDRLGHDSRYLLNGEKLGKLGFTHVHTAFQKELERIINI